MKKRILIVVLLLTAVVAVALYLGSRPSREEKGLVRVSGNVEVTTVELSFKIGGRVSRRLVDEGELVKAGQVVARMESEEIAREVDARRAEAEAARAALAELEHGFRREEISQAKAALERVEADAERLRADFARQEALFRREVISRREFEASRSACQASQAAVREAGQRLLLLRRGPRTESIDQARARLRGAQAAQALAGTRLGYTTLVSSLNGLVLSKNVEPGEQVAAGTPVVTVGELDSVWVKAFISEADLGRVKVGQRAMVTTDSYPGRRYPGRLSFISSEAEFTPKNVQTEKERVKLVFRVKIQVANPAGELKPGMPADVEIGTKGSGG